MQTVKISDFLTREEILLAKDLEDYKSICEKIVKPALERINKTTNQKNCAVRLSLGVQYALETIKRRSPRRFESLGQG